MGNCSVCGKRCADWERNTDGTYLHTTCAMPVAVWPPRPKEKEETK
jgi:hypothetical protein